MIAALTGSIATGKSTVARFFRNMGAWIVDADDIAHKILKLPVIRDEIIRHFGKVVSDSRGEIHRSTLAGIIFSDPAARRLLNELTHPVIRERMESEIELMHAQDPHSLVLADIPLLMETGEPARYGPVVLAYCPESIQLERLMRRNKLDLSAALQRIRAQIPIEEKRPRADYIIHTTGPHSETEAQVRDVYHQLLSTEREPDEKASE